MRRGDAPGDAPDPERARPATRTRAHILLAALGRTAPALSLSSADCAQLTPLVEEWFARGATEETLLAALTAGLPIPVHSPAALLHRRLTDKLPPPLPAPPPPRRRLECTECGVPGRPEALPGGVCRGCRGHHAPTRPHAPLPATAVRARAAGIRVAMTLSVRYVSARGSPQPARPARGPCPARPGTHPDHGVRQTRRRAHPDKRAGRTSAPAGRSGHRRSAGPRDGTVRTVDVPR